MSVYLDYNASAPIDKRVLSVMMDTYTSYYGNADSRTHYYGENARNVIQNARKQIADLLNVKTDEVFFTSGSTESNNIAILGLRKYGEQTGKKHIITTSIEHKAIIESTKALKEFGFTVDYVDPDENGVVSVEKIMNKVNPETLLVSVMHTNNETGVIQPVNELGKRLKEAKVLFHIDATQSCGKLVEEIQRLDYDMMSISAHKMYGPQGVGALILRKKRYKLPPVKAIMYGGPQEHGLRPGTLPTALIAGFGKAAELCLSEYKIHNEYNSKLKEIILDLLENSGVKYVINGQISNSVSNTINVSFIGVSSEALMIATKQYCGLSNGSACNSDSYNHSHVLTAMGLSEERLESAVRISWGYFVAEEELKKNLKNMLEVVKSLA